MIVYADDDELVRDTVVQALVFEGIDVHACDSGPDAMKLCREIRPDAVLLDLNMPSPDGLETAVQLRNDPLTRDLRLVAFTGRGTRELADKARRAGFDHFLVKPLCVETLVRILCPDQAT